MTVLFDNPSQLARFTRAVRVISQPAGGQVEALPYDPLRIYLECIMDPNAFGGAYAGFDAVDISLGLNNINAGDIRIWKVADCGDLITHPFFTADPAFLNPAFFITSVSLVSSASTGEVDSKKISSLSRNGSGPLSLETLARLEDMRKSLGKIKTLARRRR